jgi:hypothetical protein
MDRRPHFNRDAAWGGYDTYRDAWMENFEVLRGVVRSLSGWTRELLGAPDEEWIREMRAADRVDSTTRST